MGPRTRVIQKIDFSIFTEGFGKLNANSLPVEIKIFQDDALEHSNLLASLSKAKPNKRPRAKESGSRGPCTCPKNKCLKLYCDCFSRNVYCENCNCKNCHNTLEFEAIRKEAMTSTLDRNPKAFCPKISTVIAEGEPQVTHSKGCHCDKSACLKNYCECFKSKIACNEVCQCVGCKNIPMKKSKKQLKVNKN